MSKLTNYTVTLCTDRDSATKDIPATSPEAALTEARAIADDRDRAASLYFEPYSHHVPVNEIVVDTPHGERVAVWFSPELLLRVAAEDLLRALERALTALNTAPRFAVSALESDSYTIAAECGRAIAKARGEDNPNAA
jgi:hypothetical protein